MHLCVFMCVNAYIKQWVGLLWVKPDTDEYYQVEVNGCDLFRTHALAIQRVCVCMWARM